MTRCLTMTMGVLLATACSQTSLQNGFSRTCQAVIFWEPDQESGQAWVVGDFNSWTPGRLALTDYDGDGTYSASLVASPGLHQYRIQVGEKTYLDKFNPLTLYDSSGRENSAVDIPDCTNPALELKKLHTNRWGDIEIEAHFLRADSGIPLDIGSIRVTTQEGTLLDVTADTSPGNIHASASGLSGGKHRLTIEAMDQSGAQAAPITVPFWTQDKPFDWHDALIYQVLVDRFRRADGRMDQQASISDYHGGDLEGVRKAILDGYFESLGVNVLWLSPLYENPDGEFIGRDGYPSQAYHGYWPCLPRKVESRFGGSRALDRLVSTAHSHNIRILADVVPNHVHLQHPYWTKHRSDGWFNDPMGNCICGTTCSWTTSMEECWFTSFLPDVSFSKPRLVHQIVEDMTFWLDRFDMDGLRIDAVPMMPRMVIRHLRASLNKGLGSGPSPIYLLGETYTDRAGQAYIRYYLGEHSLSGQFDFPVMWALRDALAGRISMRELDREVDDSQQAWQGSGAIMAPILGNHDVPRFVSDVNGDELWQPRRHPAPSPKTEKPYDLLKIAWTFLLTQPGAPVIYYGDEIGLVGASDPDNRRDMRFGDELNSKESSVLEHVRRLGRARACANALRQGTRRTLVVNENLYIYIRDADDGFPCVVVLSRATVGRDLSISIPEDIKLAGDVRFVDVLGAYSATVGRTIELVLPPRTSALLLSRQDCLENNP